MSQQDYTHADIVEMLNAAAANPQRCPRNPRTCQCPGHGHTDSTRLHIVTSGPRFTGDTYPPLHFTGLMTCPCRKCDNERSTRLRPRRIRQPWEVAA
jgi:hypothetical protein